jgi:hypothetical protein
MNGIHPAILRGVAWFETRSVSSANPAPASSSADCRHLVPSADSPSKAALALAALGLGTSMLVHASQAWAQWQEQSAAAGRVPAGSTAPGTGWVAGAVANLGYSTRSLALGTRDQGLGLGHSDFSARGPLGKDLSGQLTAVAQTHDDRLETELEDAWLQTRSLPAGLQLRAGRFASQVGYLNEQHPHNDDFVERPLLYRAFLGQHWIDDGLRLNWTAPTEWYLRLGAELFSGRGLVPEGGSASIPGAFALSAKAGADIGVSHSWQGGLAWVRNRRDAGAAHASELPDPVAASLVQATHDRGHAARFPGRDLWMVDLTWKWAPDGNNRREQVRVVTEYARVTRPTGFATGAGRHDAISLAVVWRFRPEWEVGVRTDRLEVAIADDESLQPGRLREHALMVAWKPSHAQSVRLQYTTQRNGAGFEDLAGRAVQLQYIVSFGAHGAHSF